MKVRAAKKGIVRPEEDFDFSRWGFRSPAAQEVRNCVSCSHVPLMSQVKSVPILNNFKMAENHDVSMGT